MRQQKMVLPAADVTYILEQYKAGTRMNDIADMSGYSLPIVRRTVYDHGLTREALGKNNVRPVSEEMALGWLRQREAGVTVREIAKSAGVGHMRVYKHIRLLGWKGWKVPKGPGMPAEDIATIIRLRKEGYSFNEIAKHFVGRYSRQRIRYTYHGTVAARQA